MRKKMDKWKCVVAVSMVFILLTGCGSADNMVETAEYVTAYDDAATDYMTNDIYDEEYESMTTEAVAADEEAAAGTIEEVQETTDRKLIKNVNLEVETETFDELLDTVEAKTKNCGGYIESSYTYNGSSYYGRSDRNANLTIRIPAEKLDEFLSSVAEVSNIISRNDSVTDVTLQYVDLESHKNALLAEQERLLELMEQAESIEDIVTLEDRLAQVRYQIESMESQLRTYDNQVSYSTVYLGIDEVTKLTPVKEQSLGEKIATGFMDSLYGVGHGLLNFAVGLIIRLPYLVVWGIIIVVVVLIIRAIKKSRKKRKQKKAIQEEKTEQVDKVNAQEPAEQENIPQNAQSSEQK